MAKSKVEKAEEKEVSVEVEDAKKEETVEKPKLGKLEIEFNNEGLNQLRDKVNELVEFLNK